MGDEYENADVQVAVWLPSSWRERMEASADAAEITLSDWMRGAFLQHLGPERAAGLPSVKPPGNPVALERQAAAPRRESSAETAAGDR